MAFKKILIVDDSITARMMVIRQLMGQGMDRSLFVEAEDGLSGVELVHRNVYDLILTDVLMPKMDGLTFVKKLKRYTDNRNTPIIILTSLGDDSVGPEIMDLPGIYLLQKPLNSEDLARVLEEINGS